MTALRDWLAGALAPASHGDEQYVAKSGGRACRHDGTPYTKTTHASRRSKRRDPGRKARDARARRRLERRRARRAVVAAQTIQNQAEEKA